MALKGRNRTIRAFVGHTGFGKTLLASSENDGEERLVVVEGSTGAFENDYNCDVHFETVKDGARWFAEKRPTRFRVSFSVEPPEKKSKFFGTQDRRGGLPALCDLVWQLQDKALNPSEAPIKLVVEEFDQHFLDGYCDPKLVHVALRGRHRQINMDIVSQAPYYIPIKFRREMDKMFAFHLSEDNDLDWVKRFPGSTKDVAETVKGLERLHYIEVEKNGQHTRGRIELA